jgi:hypothetical protein
MMLRNPSRRDNRIGTKRCIFCGAKHLNGSKIQERHDKYIREGWIYG